MAYVLFKKKLQNVGSRKIANNKTINFEKLTRKKLNII